MECRSGISIRNLDLGSLFRILLWDLALGFCSGISQATGIAYALWDFAGRGTERGMLVLRWYLLGDTYRTGACWGWLQDRRARRWSNLLTAVEHKLNQCICTCGCRLCFCRCFCGCMPGAPPCGCACCARRVAIRKVFGDLASCGDGRRTHGPFRPALTQKA